MWSFIFKVLTLGLYSKEVKQNPIRKFRARVSLEKFGRPSEKVFHRVLARYFQGKELDFVKSLNSVDCLSFDTQENGYQYLNDLGKAGFPIADSSYVQPMYSEIFKGDHYTQIDHLGFCSECKGITACDERWNPETDDYTSVCESCDSDDVLPFTDMKPKEVLKHVTKLQKAA